MVCPFSRVSLVKPSIKLNSVLITVTTFRAYVNFIERGVYVPQWNWLSLTFPSYRQVIVIWNFILTGKLISCRVKQKNIGQIKKLLKAYRYFIVSFTFYNIQTTSLIRKKEARNNITTPCLFDLFILLLRYTELWSHIGHVRR